LHDLYHTERMLRQKGYALIAGVDEAGRGPLAGPVVAGAVILPFGSSICDLKDSKLLSEKKRQKVYEEIRCTALSYAFAVVDENYIDTYNILNATYLAMKKAVEKLSTTPDFVLVDALKIPEMDIPQQGIIKGDRLCACIAAASIVAKVERDKIMHAYDSKYPQYGFYKNKGYATKNHVESIKMYGRCPIHRKSFNVKGLGV
jgi:ribonuclease HII